MSKCANPFDYIIIVLIRKENNFVNLNGLIITVLATGCNRLDENRLVNGYYSWSILL